MNGFVGTLMKELKEQKGAPLAFDKWFSDSFKIINKENNIKYPYEVRIPYPVSYYLEQIQSRNSEFDELKRTYKGIELSNRIDDLLKEIIVPMKTFTVTDPFTFEGTEIWTGNTAEGINLRVGYEKGDSRFPTALKLADDAVHGKVGGRTGSGKSVLANQIICGMLLEYPPWELVLTLCDFKFVEMVRYCNTVPTPQVANVVACDDIDYVVSLLEKFKIDMVDRQDLFAICNVGNLKSFRKKFNLHLPRLLLLIDEVQQLFQKNPKKNPQIELEIDKVGRLGRALGAHILILSQSMKGTMSKDSLANFKLGISLGADAEVSTMLLGNEEASTLQGKGKALANFKTGKKEENALYRVPYIPEDRVTEILVGLNECNDKFLEPAITNKYDEKLIRKRKDFMRDFQRYVLNDIFVLGDAVKYKEGDGASSEFLFFFRGQDSENVISMSLNAEELYYTYNLLAINSQKLSPNDTNLMISGSPYTDKLVKDFKFNNIDISKNISALDYPYEALEFRKNLIALEEISKKYSSVKEFYDERMKKYVEAGCEETQQKDYVEFKALYEGREKFGWDKELRPQSFSKINVWIYDAQGIVGLGRDAKSNNLETFKKALFDCTIYNMTFFVFCSALNDMATILGGFNHRLLGASMDIKEKNKLQLDENISPLLCAYQNRVDLENIVKFKKFNLETESIVEVRKVIERKLEKQEA